MSRRLAASRELKRGTGRRSDKGMRDHTEGLREDKRIGFPEGCFPRVGGEVERC